MIYFKNMEFLPIDAVSGFVPVNVVFPIGKLPRLIDAKGNTIKAWKVG